MLQPLKRKSTRPQHQLPAKSHLLAAPAAADDLIMQYRNHDLDLNKFLIKDGHIVTDIAELKPHQLSREIYFRPSYAPLVSEADADLGSCFNGYSIPTASFSYQVNDSGISCIKHEPKLDLDDYIRLIHQDIGRQIINVYQMHKQVTLAYSGGIDSMVLLSFIMAYGLLSRTNVVCVENHTQISAHAMHNHADNKQLVLLLLNKLKPKLKSTTWHHIDVEDLAYSFNHGKLEHLKCYTTHAILRRYHDSAFLFGYHGNQILLHKPLFVDELILQGKVSVTDAETYLSNTKNYYTQCLRLYDCNKEKIGVDRTHFLKKPWSLMDGINGNRVYAPIGSTLTFDLLRDLDFSSMSLPVIADALVARHIIGLNVGTELDEFIGVESLSDMDNLQDSMIPVDLLDPSWLTVPNSLNHHPEGLDWITEQIAQARVTGLIAINSLTSVKMLHWINQL
jgi:hypothetical protein